MASTFSNVLSTEEIDLLLNTVEVNDARMQLTPNTNKVDFTMHLSDTVKQALLDRLGLNLQNVADVPFRWIRGDTVAHADQAKDGQPFDNTYLMYLTDSEGTLDVDGQSYPIAKGAGYVFSEGLMHGTSNMGSEPRLMLGPMNNMGVHVGGTIITTPTIKECYADNLCTFGKKFIGGNRDASAVTSRRTATTLTNLKTIDPKQKSDAVNVQNRQQALTRVRAGGYMVPKKVSQKYLL